MLCAVLLGMGHSPGISKTRAVWGLALVLTARVECGGGGGVTNTGPPPNPGTPPGTYTITVSAQVGTVTRSMTVTLIVQSSFHQEVVCHATLHRPEIASGITQLHMGLADVLILILFLFFYPEKSRANGAQFHYPRPAFY
jgi:hypothetical protein